MAEQPTALALIISTAIISCLTGYMLGIGSSLGIFPSLWGKKVEGERRRKRTSGYDDEEESEEEEISEGESVLDHAPDWAGRAGEGVRQRVVGKEKGVKEKKVEAKTKELEDTGEECKLVLVVRTDLGMTKGKIAAQCSHATLACYKSLLHSSPHSKLLQRWERSGQMKVALQVKTEDELETLQARAISLGLVAEIIADAGRTQIAAGSHTVLGIGPGPKSLINEITGSLKLL